MYSRLAFVQFRSWLWTESKWRAIDVWSEKNWILFYWIFTIFSAEERCDVFLAGGTEMWIFIAAHPTKTHAYANTSLLSDSNRSEIINNCKQLFFLRVMKWLRGPEEWTRQRQGWKFGLNTPDMFQDVGWYCAYQHDRTTGETFESHGLHFYLRCPTFFLSSTIYSNLLQ